MAEDHTQFIGVIGDVYNFITERREDTWKGAFGGMIVITLPPEQDDLTLGNVAGFPPAEGMDQTEMVMTSLLSFITGLLLMGFDVQSIISTVAYAQHMAENSAVIDTGLSSMFSVPDLPDN